MSAEYLSQYKFAQLCGISRQAVSKAVKEGRLVLAKNKIDPEHPTNKYFVDRLTYNKNPKKPSPERVKEIKASKRGRKKEPIFAPPPPPEPVPESPKSDDGLLQPQTEKDFQATRLTRIKADHALLNYAKTLETLIDSDVLHKKMGAFMSFLTTSLVNFPNEVADLLWMRAEASDDPTREIRIFLEDKMGNIVHGAKKAAEELRPPKTKKKYILVQVEDD